MKSDRTLSRWSRVAPVSMAAAGVAVLLVSGGAGAVASASGVARAAAIPLPPKSAAVAALVPAAIAKKGSVQVAMDATYAPDEFVAANGKTILGMDADLNAALGAVMGIKWNALNATFDTIIPGLQSGKFNVGNSSFTVTPAREKVVNFVTYFQAGEGFYVKSSSSLKLNGLTSLCGLAVSVETGTVEQSDAQSAVGLCKKAGKKADSVLSFSTQSEANLAVSSGRAQLGFADSQVAGYIVQQSKGLFKLDGSAFAVAPYGIAFPKSSTLDKATLAAVKVLMKDGIYSKILAKWGVQSGAIANPAIK
ncbi:MAG: extracellular solute-binding protein family 3 [Acidimicrobiaceae bacterium]|nr:extracellular solute-binding protein family 3 [Acidimicrobiaceae bacterium]